MKATPCNSLKEIRRKNIIIGLAIFAVSALFYLTYYNYSLNMVDEGMTANAAWRILEGQKLYRDFDHAYGPGRFYVIAFLFRMFGINIIVTRLFWLVVISLNTVLIFFLSSRIMPRKFAIIPALILLLVPAQWYKAFFIFFPLLNALLLFLYIELDRLRWLLAFGAATSVALVFRQDAALYVMATGLTVLLVNELFRGGAGFAKRVITRELWYLATIALLLIPVIVYFSDCLYEMAYETLIYPIFKGGYATLGSAPYPSVIASFETKGLLSWDTYQAGLFYLAPAIYLSAVVLLALRLVKKEWRRKDTGLLAVVLMAMVVYYKTLTECQYDHLLQTTALAYVIATYMMYVLYEKLKEKNTKSAIFVMALFLVAVASFIYYNIFVCTGNENGSIAARRTMHVLLKLDRAKVYYSSDKDINKVVRYINEYTKPGDYIYVFPQHGFYYFVTNRRNATRQDFHVAKFTNKDTVRNIIQGLKEKNVKLIIYDEVSTHIGYKRPERLYYRTYAKDAYKYIFNNYTIFDRFGRYRIMRKKGGDVTK